MAATNCLTMASGGSICLLDYWHVGRVRIAKITPDGTLLVSRVSADANMDRVRGVVGQGRFNNGFVPMAYLSCEFDDAHGTPDYYRNLILMIDGKLLGDGFSVPRISWSRGLFYGVFKVVLEDGWSFESRYRRPLLRELWWRLNVGGTLDEQPVDFIEKMVAIVSEARPKWIVKSR